jgi:hypothetical protein
MSTTEKPNRRQMRSTRRQVEKMPKTEDLAPAAQQVSRLDAKQIALTIPYLGKRNIAKDGCYSCSFCFNSACLISPK